MRSAPKSPDTATAGGPSPHEGPESEQPGTRSGTGADSLWLPMARDTQRKAPPGPPAAPASADHAARRVDRAMHTVLVVDDSDSARYAIARGLRAAGFCTQEAGGASEALKLAEFVSAVVLDVHLPDGHGVDICRVLRARPRTTGLPVIHISAVELESHHQQAAQEAGSDGYYVAPVDIDVLARRLDELLEDRRPGAPRHNQA
jgi:CheY-like chemotaxis protein